MKNPERANALLRFEKSAALLASPEKFFSGEAPFSKGEAALFWGKAALSTANLLSPSASRARVPALVIAPEGSLPPRLWPGARIVQGEHPLPGAGSFAAGAAIVELFDFLRREDIRKLRIYLSGGASSLAWIPRAGKSPRELRTELESLYRQILPIRELNRERAKLCALKDGGAARLLRKLAPRVRAQVRLISDVSPFGPETVGSGPFWGEGLPHRVLWDNPRWIAAVAEEAKSEGWEVASLRSGWVAPESEWGEALDGCVSRLLARPDSAGSLALLGGEALIRLGARSGPGGRLTHLAAGFAARHLDDLRAGRLGFLAMSSDGVDGKSGASGVLIGSSVAKRLSRRELLESRARFESAIPLRRAGALIPAAPSGTNVQDLVLVTACAKPSSSRSPSC